MSNAAIGVTPAIQAPRELPPAPQNKSTARSFALADALVIPCSGAGLNYSFLMVCVLERDAILTQNLDSARLLTA